MICSIPDHDSLSSILNITELKSKDLPWSQAPMKHEQDHRLVALERERLQEHVHLLVIHGTRKTLHGLHMNSASHRLLESLSLKRDKAMILLMLHGGLRPGEVLTLQLGDIQY